MTYPVKTAQGQDELTSRTRRLGQRHRTVLLLVDGRRSVHEVRTLALQAGAAPNCFDELLAWGLIDMPASVVPQAAAPEAAAVPEDLGDSSLLPPSRSLQHESVLGELAVDSVLLPEPFPSGWMLDEHTLFEEARELLIRAVRAEAPVAGSLTLLRLKRARSRTDLAGLIGEVESRIVKSHRSLAAQQTLQRVRQLLSSEPTLPVTG